MNHAPIRSWLILCAVCAAAPSLSLAAEKRAPSVLANVKGLDKPVTYTETKIPLGELMQKVAADTGVALTAARDVADEPVAVVVKEFSARELLEQLADLLDYQWSRRTTTDHGRPTTEGNRGKPPSVVGGPSSVVNAVRYEIWQDLPSKQREESLRQALFAGMEQRFREEMSICRELSGKSQEEMGQIWDEATRWRERLAKLSPRERQALENSAEGRKEARRHAYAQALWSPVERTLGSLMTHLPPEQWVAMRTGRQLVFSSDPQRGELPIPPDVLRRFRTSRPTLSPPGQPNSAQPDNEQRWRQMEQEQQERWSQAEQYRVTVRLGEHSPRPDQLNLFALATPISGGKPLGQWYNNPNFHVNVWAEPAAATVEENPHRRALLEQDPLLSAGRPFQPDTRPFVDPLLPGASRTVRLLAEILPELARAYDVNLIADSYWMAAAPSGVDAMAGTAPLFEVLDRLAGTDHAWDRRGELVRIRDRKWYLDRPAEIPLRHVRRWVAMTDQRGALPLEEMAAAATTLTDYQIATLDRPLFQRGILPPQLDDLRTLEMTRHLLRLYARLLPAQQQVLREGKSLTIAQIAPPLRSLVLATLNRIGRNAPGAMELKQWDRGHLSLTRTPDARLREQRGRSVTWRLESASAPRAAMPPDAVTRFPVTRWRLEIDYGAQAPAAVGLIVAADAATPE
jgi:hypothetical protein